MRIRMGHIVLLLAGLVLLQRNARASEERYSKILREWQSAQAKFERTYKSATQAERDKGWFPSLPDVNSYAPRFLAVARKHPKTSDALNSCLWVAENLCHDSVGGNEVEEARKILLQDHRESPRLAGVCPQLVLSSPGPETEQFLHALIERSPHRTVQGKAMLALASYQRHSLLDRKAAEKTYEEVATRFGDVEGGSLRDAARRELFELQQLVVGKIVPEIKGQDPEGKTFSLGEYRGKVVAIYFFGDWFPACRTFYPQLRALSQKLEGKPFALLGVNSDPPDRIKEIAGREQFNWRFWCDGRGGPIAASWNVSLSIAQPATYVVDAKGVIRYKNVGAKKMAEAVEVLLAEMEKGKD